MHAYIIKIAKLTEMAIYVIICMTKLKYFTGDIYEKS